MPEEKQFNNREKFLRNYANIPLSARKEIVLVLEEGPITWEVAYFEVKNQTERGEKILDKLDELNLI